MRRFQVSCLYTKKFVALLALFFDYRVRVRKICPRCIRFAEPRLPLRRKLASFALDFRIRAAKFPQLRRFRALMPPPFPISPLVRACVLALYPHAIYKILFFRAKKPVQKLNKAG
jgi:hypothetical protein